MTEQSTSRIKLDAITLRDYLLEKNRLISLGWYKFDTPDNYEVYKMYSDEILNWVEQQPKHMWKHHGTIPKSYIFSEEMEVLFLLRWS